MKRPLNNPIISDYWDRACQAKGHTGYGDPLLHTYDQPVRLSTVEKILNQFYPNGLKNFHALDVGCGSGDYIALLRSRGARVHGVDISQEVIDRTASRFTQDSEVSLESGAILEVVLQPSSFDIITCVTVLQHIVDEEEFEDSINMLGSALRPGGHMIILELAPPHHQPVEIKDSTGFVYLIERPPFLWAETFHRSGLKIVGRPVFPQFGIAMLRGLDWLIGRIRPRIPITPVAPPSLSGRSEADAKNSYKKLRRAVWKYLRRAILFFTRPFDHWFGWPLPPARFRHYQIYVVTAA